MSTRSKSMVPNIVVIIFLEDGIDMNFLDGHTMNADLVLWISKWTVLIPKAAL